MALERIAGALRRVEETTPVHTTDFLLRSTTAMGVSKYRSSYARIVMSTFLANDALARAMRERRLRFCGTIRWSKPSV